MKDTFLPIDTDRVGKLSGNTYKSIVIAGKRANQVTVELKEELAQKLAEFAPSYDNLEEVMENKEQIEISRHYERKPKATQVAMEQWLTKDVYFRDPHENEL